MSECGVVEPSVWDSRADWQTKASRSRKVLQIVIEEEEFGGEMALTPMYTGEVGH